MAWRIAAVEMHKKRVCQPPAKEYPHAAYSSMVFGMTRLRMCSPVRTTNNISANSTGFIRLNGLRLRTGALRDRKE